MATVGMPNVKLLDKIKANLTFAFQMQFDDTEDTFPLTIRPNLNCMEQVNFGFQCKFSKRREGGAKLLRERILLGRQKN